MDKRTQHLYVKKNRWWLIITIIILILIAVGLYIRIDHTNHNTIDNSTNIYSSSSSIKANVDSSSPKEETSSSYSIKTDQDSSSSSKVKASSSSSSSTTDSNNVDDLKGKSLNEAIAYAQQNQLYWSYSSEGTNPNPVVDSVTINNGQLVIILK